MLVFLIARLGQAAVVLFALVVAVFLAVFALGDPTHVLVSDRAPEEVREAMRSSFGLDKPLPTQFVLYLTEMLNGNFGFSFVYRTPVLDEIARRLPATLELAFVSFVVSVCLGLLCGLFVGSSNSKTARLMGGGTAIAVSLPSFWVALSFILLFGVVLRWFPISGRGEVGSLLGIESSLLTLDGWRHIALPAATLAVWQTGVFARLIAAGLHEALRSDYIRFAEAKGVRRYRIILIHGLRNALVPLVTAMGILLAQVIAFSTVVESVFAWPGIGKLMIDSILRFDRPMLSGLIIVVSTIFIVMNAIVDIAVKFIDPRLREG